MPSQRLCRLHVLKIRSLLEENYKPASANRMLAALRGVLRECWHAGLISTDDYQAAARSRRCAGSRSRAAAISPPASCAASSRPVPGRLGRRLISQNAGARRRRDAAFLAIAYGSGVRGAEAIALDLADLDFAAGQLRVRQGKGKRPPPGASGPLGPARPRGLAAGPG
jgi:integrase